MMKTRIVLAAIIAAMFLAIAGNATAQSPTAVIRIWNGSGLPGANNITVPITLESQNGAQVSGFNFDLNFNGSQLRVSSITSGSALPGGKILSWNPQPCTGSCVVIVFGLDQVTIPDGTVANVVFDVLPGANPGNVVTLGLANAAAAHPTDNDPDANLESTINGSFTILTPPTNTPVPSDTTLPSNTPIPTNTPVPPTATNSATPGPSPTPTITLTPSITPTPSNTFTPTMTYTPGPSPTASNTPSGTLTPSPTATITATSKATTTQTQVSEGAGEGLELEGVAAATGTALAKFEGAVAATSTALAEEVAARPTDEIIDPETSSGVIQRPELFIAAGLLLLAIVFGGGAGYLAWRRQQE